MWKLYALIAFLVASTAPQEAEKTIKGLAVDLEVDATSLHTIDVVQARIYLRNNSTAPFDISPAAPLYGSGMKFLLCHGELKGDEVSSRSALPSPHEVALCMG